MEKRAEGLDTKKGKGGDSIGKRKGRVERQKKKEVKNLIKRRRIGEGKREKRAAMRERERER